MRIKEFITSLLFYWKIVSIPKKISELHPGGTI